MRERRDSVTLMGFTSTSSHKTSFDRPRLVGPEGPPTSPFEPLHTVAKHNRPALTCRPHCLARAKGLEPYRFSTPIGWIGSLRSQSSSIGLRVPRVGVPHQHFRPHTKTAFWRFLPARAKGLEPSASSVHVIRYFHNGMDYIFTVSICACRCSGI